MNESKNQKIIKTILSLMISFLIIFISAMFARAASNTILPENSSISVFINDYLDMMMQRIDKIAVNMKIKRNSVSEYQVNLITQSISDYVGYSMYQTADIVKNFNPSISHNKTLLDKYKNDYYKMTIENPYLRGMTIFNTDGKMLLNLYLSRNKSWPLELQNNLIKEIKQKGSLVLNAANENSFYIMEYIKNNYGEIIVSTRNDYAYVSDIAMYYQVADKRLYVSDVRNSVYNVREAIGDNNIEKVSSVINRYAYYKKQPSFIVNDSLSVSMIGKEYPNYFELIVLAITALLILVCQLFIKAIAAFFKHIIQIKSSKDYAESIKGADELINDNIINTSLPVSNPIEEMPPMIQKVHYKIPNKYIKEINSDNKDDNNKSNIGNNILNIVSAIKDEINMCKNRFAINKSDLTQNKKEEIINNNETELENHNEIINSNNYDDIEKAFFNINNDLRKEHSIAIENYFTEDNSIVENNKNNIFNLYKENEAIDINNYIDKNIDNSYNNMKAASNEFMSIPNEQIKNVSSKESKLQDDFIYNALSIKNVIKTADENNPEYKKIDNDFYKKSIKNNLLSNYREKEEEKNKEFVRKLFNKKNYNYVNNNYNNVHIDMLNSYNKTFNNIKVKDEDNIENKEILEEKNMNDKEEISNSRTDDVFAAFDKMLSSIINKAEEDAKKNITKKN